MSHEIENIIKNVAIKERNQIDILQLKSTIREIKNVSKCLNSTFWLAEEKISELEDRANEIMQSMKKKEKWTKTQRNVVHH